MTYVFSIDQGTSSSRTLVCDANAEVVHVEQQEFNLSYPQDGWVEQNPNDLYQSVISTYQAAMASYLPSKVALTNQRETTIVWRRDTGEPIYNAIVWQDRRTHAYCQALRANGHEAMIAKLTGLMIDPYFSASKIAWILDHVEGARAAADNDELMFGTVDTWVLYKLTGGATYATDATNASRTQLFDIHNQCWSPQLCSLFNIPMSMLPKVLDSADDYGHVSQAIDPSSPPIVAVIGDQQAALVGQRCFTAGSSKSTFGTGSFLMVNTGNQATDPANGLLTTVAYRLNGTAYYAIEGSIFMAGASVQWLRDSLQIIDKAPQSQTYAAQAKPDHQVILVPAFTGLGAPHWRPDARATLSGMTRDTGRAELCAATLEASAFQTKDLLEAIAELGQGINQLIIDGGMSANTWFCQALADVLNMPVMQSDEPEGTAIGAALLAIYGADVVTKAPAAKANGYQPTEVQPHPRQGAWNKAISRITD